MVIQGAIQAKLALPALTWGSLELKKIQRLFNLYPGEGRKAINFAFLTFLWSLAAACGFTLGDGLFLEHVGAQSLPFSYILIALSLFGVAAFFLPAVHKIELSTIFLVLIGLGIAFFSTSCVLTSLGLIHYERWFWFILKVFGKVFYIAMGTCFWMFVDEYHDMQDAKRMYSLFNSGIFLGEACAGLIINQLLPKLGLGGLFGMITLALIASVLWIRRTKRTFTPFFDENLEGTKEEKVPFKKVVKEALTSPFTMSLIVTNLVFQMLVIVTEFSYMETFERVFTNIDPITGVPDENALTQFLGKCFAFVAFGNIIIGLFFYSRTIRRFGVYNVVFFTPTFFTAVYFGWNLIDTLGIALLGFVAVEGFLYTIDDNNFTLLLNAVPARIKPKVRVMAESFFDPLAILMSAIVLIFFSSQNRIIGLILGLVALAMALIIRVFYSKALFKNLSENALHFEKRATERLKSLSKKEKKRSEGILIRKLMDATDETDVIFQFEILMQLEDKKILPRLIMLAKEKPAEVRLKLLSIFEKSIFRQEEMVLDLVMLWSKDPLQELSAAAQFYLAEEGLIHPEKAAILLKDSNLAIQGAAILTLRTRSTSKQEAHAIEAEHKLKELLSSDEEEKICMGVKLLGFEEEAQEIETLLPFLSHASPKVKSEAAKSILRLSPNGHFRFVPLLLPYLSSSLPSTAKVDIIQAIGVMGDTSIIRPLVALSVHFNSYEKRAAENTLVEQGLRSVPQLLDLTKDSTEHDKCRLLACKALGRLALEQLQANQLDIVKEEIKRAEFYFYYHHTIQNKYPSIPLQVLQDALLTGYHSSIDFIIQLLAVAGSVEDAELLSQSLRSSSPKLYSSAVETLEKTCDAHLFSFLEPLIGDWPLEEKLRHYEKKHSDILSLDQLLDAMEDSPSLVDPIISSTMQAELSLPYWRETLRRQMLRHDEIFHHFAYELLESRAR